MISINWGLGIGDWGVGIGGWGPYPKPQTQNPKPQTPVFDFFFFFVNKIFKF